jgi:hypothetical protein
MTPSGAPRALQERVFAARAVLLELVFANSAVMTPFSSRNDVAAVLRVSNASSRLCRY